MTASEKLANAHAIARLRERDATLFSDDAAAQARVTARLGWTDLASRAAEVVPHVREVSERMLAEGTTDVVLLGMGGSSLAALVMGEVLGTPLARLHVLDTTSPVTVQRVLDDTDPARTCHIVASKSGGTVEPNALYAILRARADAALGREAAGGRFVAVTDPGSSLETLASDEGFAAVLTGLPDVGGRFSALSVFGLLPAAMIGCDIDAVVASAVVMEAACAEPDALVNPAAQLAAFIVEQHDAKRDKLTIVASPPLASFGLWVEQLVAESLGKHGQGVVPVIELSGGIPDGYGADRAAVVVRAIGDGALAMWAGDAPVPVHEIVLSAPTDLGAEFVRWEYAVALAGHLTGVNPFDEPNVAEAKAATAAVLDGASSVPELLGQPEGTAVAFDGGMFTPDHADNSMTAALAHALANLRRHDYVALLAFLPDDAEVLAPLRQAVPRLASALSTAICLELGPRYLHSTGQLHKGGPDNGIFVVVTTRDDADLEVPGMPWTLRELHLAQAAGDAITLAAHDRRVMRLELPDASHASVSRLARALLAAASVSDD